MSPRLASLSAAVVLLASVMGCTGPTTQPVPRQAMPVAASFDASWNAVIDAFAEQNVPIANMEKASGFIKSQPIPIRVDGRSWADCGGFMGMKQGPDRAEFNAIVRGNSDTSSVKVTASWSYVDEDHKTVQCVSLGTWETSLEQAIKARAES